MDLISPYGGKLVNLIAVLPANLNLPSIQISERSMCDLELLATGAFSPLDRFMGRADYQSVLAKMRLADGTVFPIPVTLPVADISGLQIGQKVVLRNSKNLPVAVMKITEMFGWDFAREANMVYGTTDSKHPLVAEMRFWGKVNLSGPIEAVSLPAHSDFPELRRTPAEVRALLAAMGNRKVVAFQTRNPMHRAHEELTKRAAQKVGGILLIHPVVGITKPGDVDHFTRVRAYKALADKHYPAGAVLSLLPLAMRMGGPREAVWHAIIRRNFGASHFIVGRDHAGPGKNSQGEDFYGPYAAQKLVQSFAAEIGVEIVASEELVYIPDKDKFEEASKVTPREKVKSLSGTKVREDYLARGKLLPKWFTRPEVAKVLAGNFPPRYRQGFCIWFTGLSGAGKSTVAESLTLKLMEKGRQVTVLDGDVVRTHLSKGLGFSKEDRETNILRIGFVASEIVRHHGAVVCAAVSPYEDVRNQARNLIGPDHFVLVYVNTPLEVCEKRDIKGMYAKARQGLIKGFTGIDDPYDVPKTPDIVLETEKSSPEQNAQKIIEKLEELGFLRK